VNSAAVGNDGRIYAFISPQRGNYPEADFPPYLRAYDIATNTWSASIHPPVTLPQKWSGIASAAAGRIYVAGGSTTDGSSATVFLFDPRANTWQSARPMPAARSFWPLLPAGVAAYDSAQDSWGPVSPLKVPRVRPATAMGLDGRLYVLGGTNPNSEGWGISTPSRSTSWARHRPAPATAPAAPTNLSASAGKGKGTVSLKWTQSATSGVTQNRIYRSTSSGGPYTLLATVNAGTTFTDTSVASRMTYYYVMTAVRTYNYNRTVVALQKGADVSATDRDGRTALHFAVLGKEGAEDSFPSEELIQLLLRARARLDAVDNQGRTPLFLALEKDAAIPVKLLLEQGADVNVAASDGRTPLMLAAIHRNLVVTAALIERGAKVDAADRQGNTAFYYSLLPPPKARDAGEEFSRNLNTAFFKAGALSSYLLEKGADPRTVGAKGLSGLHLIAAYGTPDLLKKAMARGGDVDMRASGGVTPLMMATMSGRADIAKVLLEKGADPKAADEKGVTVLMCAAEGARYVIAERLLAAGADLAVRAASGETARDFALKRKHTALVNLLDGRIAASNSAAPSVSKPQ
jgi:ankyrin repeat protein